MCCSNCCKGVSIRTIPVQVTFHHYPRLCLSVKCVLTGIHSICFSKCQPALINSIYVKKTKQKNSGVTRHRKFTPVKCMFSSTKLLLLHYYTISHNLHKIIKSLHISMPLHKKCISLAASQKCFSGWL